MQILRSTTIAGAALKGYSDVHGIDIPYINPDSLVLLVPATATIIKMTSELLKGAAKLENTINENPTIDPDNLKIVGKITLSTPILATIGTTVLVGVGYSSGWVLGQLTK